MTTLSRNTMVKMLLALLVLSLTFTVMADRLHQQAVILPSSHQEESLPILDNTLWNQSQVQLTVSSSAGGTDWATFGVAQNATAGFDTFWDEPEPPMPPFAPSVQATFVYSEQFVSKQTVSILPSATSLTWPLQISLDISNICNLTNVTTTWTASAIAAIPSDYEVVLSLANSTINMRQQQTYAFLATTGSYNGSIAVWIDATPPTITRVTAFPEVQLPDHYINISANVTDYVGVNTVALRLTYPDNSTENVTITQNRTGDTYFCNRTYQQLGGYVYSIWAQDNRGNTNTSSLYGFVITQVQYSLTLLTNGTGSGTIQASPAAPYYAGTNVTVWANASNNSTFTRWYGDLSGTTTPQILTMNNNKTVIAQFTKKGTYTLTISKNGTGYGTVEQSPVGPYYYGDQVTLWANASTNSTFTGWYGDLNGTTTPQTLTMDRNKTVTAEFCIQEFPDTTPPVTTATLSGTMGKNGWYVSDVTVTLTATDPRYSHLSRDGPSGVNHTYYKVDSGPWSEYTAPFVVSGDGSHNVSYYSDDHAGNVETVKSVSFKIDRTPPMMTLSKQKLGFNQVKFTATVSDATSGIAHVDFLLDGALQFNDTQSPYEWTWTGQGNHTVTATAYDMAGNTQSQSMSTPLVLSVDEKSVQLYLMEYLRQRTLGE